LTLIMPSILPLRTSRAVVRLLQRRQYGLLMVRQWQKQQQKTVVAAGTKRRCLSNTAGDSGTSVSSSSSSTITPTKKGDQGNLLFRVGAPFVLFSILASWTVGRALEGRIKEMETAKGRTTQSLRQAALEVEHEDMMERLNKIVDQDFDNTKRIQRPEEILQQRREERAKRNAWHRRLYRGLFGESRPE